jgi:hypothetical protein
MTKEESDSKVILETKNNSDSGNSKINNGLIFKREEVGGKVRFSYILYLDGNFTTSDNLKALGYAREQLENIILNKKIEEKIIEYHKESVNE